MGLNSYLRGKQAVQGNLLGRSFHSCTQNKQSRGIENRKRSMMKASQLICLLIVLALATKGFGFMPHGAHRTGKREIEVSLSFPC